MLKTFFSTLAIFAKIGLSVFGGGYAMLPVAERELVNRRHWLSREELADFYALAQCQSGPIAINVAVHTGTKQHGVMGGIAAAIGITLPSFVIILIIAMLLQNFAHIKEVQHAFNGIKVAVAALVLNAAWGMVKDGVKHLPSLIICIAAFLLLFFKLVSPIIIVIGAAIAGIIIGLVNKKRLGGKEGGAA